MFTLERVVSINYFIGVAVGLIFTVLVFAFTPVLNPKHPVSGDVYKRSKKIVRMFCLFIDVLLLVCILANIRVVYNAVSVMMVLYGGSLVAVLNKKNSV